QHTDGTPAGGWQPDGRLDGRTAVELYTAESAYAAFLENASGRIKLGFRADFTVMDGDPSTCNDKDLLDLQVLYTVVDGRVVFDHQN
ncbi:amidohydrolase family protein, partial [bacterium]|nr:amidohydrolase family protein [bacterium]